MSYFEDLWSKIESDEINYRKPSHTYSECSVYITEDYVFKKSTYERKEDLRRSKNIIQYLYEKNVSVPNVLFYSEDRNLAVYERIEGNSLKQVTDNKYAYKSGDLLSNIHNFSFDSFGCPEIDRDNNFSGEMPSLIEYLDHTVSVSEDIICDDSRFNDLFEIMKQKLKVIDSVEKNSSIVHFDYNLTNVLCNEDQCFAIDFMDAELGLPSLDVVYHYIRMDQSGRSEEFKSAFLDGYGQSIEDMTEIGLYLAVIHETAIGAYWERNNTDYRFDLESYHDNISSFAEKYVF